MNRTLKLALKVTSGMLMLKAMENVFKILRLVMTMSTGTLLSISASASILLIFAMMDFSGTLTFALASALVKTAHLDNTGTLM